MAYNPNILKKKLSVFGIMLEFLVMYETQF